MPKRRGHGWTRRKGFSKKHRRAQKDNVAAKITEEIKKQTRSKYQQPIHIPQLRQGVTRQMIIDGIRERMIERCNWHSPECYYYGQRNDCLACMGY
jgi:hypothetical protein